MRIPISFSLEYFMTLFTRVFDCEQEDDSLDNMSQWKDCVIKLLNTHDLGKSKDDMIMLQLVLGVLKAFKIGRGKHLG